MFVKYLNYNYMKNNLLKKRYLQVVSELLSNANVLTMIIIVYTFKVIVHTLCKREK